MPVCTARGVGSNPVVPSQPQSSKLEGSSDDIVAITVTPPPAVVLLRSTRGGSVDFAEWVQPVFLALSLCAYEAYTGRY